MPRLNVTGDLWCAGIAGAGFYAGDFDAQGHARVQHQQHPAGMRGFLTDEIAVTQSNDTQVLGVNCKTGVKTPVAQHGASEVQANGGVWASFAAPGVNAPPGVSTSTGLHLPAAYMGASTGPMRNDCVGPDGSIAIREQYHSAGPWHVYRPDGSRWLLTQADAANIQLLRNGRTLWREDWTWKSIGMSPPQPLTTPAWNLRYLELPDGPWLVYQAKDGRVIAHPNGASDGVVLGAAIDAFGIDAVPLPDGRIRVIWATSEGEAPHSIVTTQFRTTDARVSLLDTPAPEKPHVALLPRKIWISPFYSYSERYGDTPLELHTGNAICVVQDAHDPSGIHRELSRLVKLEQPLIVATGQDIDPMHLNLIIAWWASGANFADLQTNVEHLLTQPEKPIIAYLDQGNTEDWPAAAPAFMQSGRVWPSVMAYRGSGEPLGAFKGRMERMLDRVASYGGYMGLTPRFDDPDQAGSSWAVEDTLAAMPLYNQWLRDYPICVMMPFADRRGHGISHYPALRAWAEAFLQANPARPNRFDYWRSGEVSIDEVLRNKLMQSTHTMVLLDPEKQYLLAKLDGVVVGPPDPTPDPKPDPTLEELLRDQTDVIVQVVADYSHLHAPDWVDQAIHRLNKRNNTKRYGRKARNSDGSNPNSDVITIQLDPNDFSKKKMIDVLIDERVPVWNVIPAEEEANNGFWRPPVNPDRDSQ